MRALPGRRTYFFLFRSIHEVLKAEKLLKQTAAGAELVPVPRAVSSDCGVCLCCDTSPSELLPLLKDVTPEKCVFLEGEEYHEAG